MEAATLTLLSNLFCKYCKFKKKKKKKDKTKLDFRRYFDCFKSKVYVVNLKKKVNWSFFEERSEVFAHYEIIVNLGAYENKVMMRNLLSCKIYF